MTAEQAKTKPSPLALRDAILSLVMAARTACLSSAPSGLHIHGEECRLLAAATRRNLMAACTSAEAEVRQYIDDFYSRSSPEDLGYVPLSDDCKSVFIDGMGIVPLMPAECTRSHPHENMDPICELRTVIARLEHEKAINNWHLIETAPVDRPVIVLWKFDIGQSICRKDECGLWVSQEGIHCTEERFSHWMPLPKAPAP